MVKAILGIVLSIGLVIGGVVVADGLDLLRGDAAYDQVRACGDLNRNLPPDQQDRCWQRFREQTEASDGKEKLLGGVLGLAVAGLLWLLAWLFYIKPRRRQAGASDQGM
jgi:hypothetical protein